MSARAAAALVLLASHAALAAPSDHGRAADAAAARAYKAGDYKSAASLYEAAYAADPDPAYLFDIAQALRLSTQCAEASTYYHRFLDAVPNPPNLDKVKRYLDEADTCAAALVPRAAPLAPTAAAPHQPAPPPPRDAHPTRTYGLVALGAGALVVGAGALFTARASHWSSVRSGLCPAGACTWDSALAAEAARDDDHGHHFAQLADASYALGAVALVGGALLALHVAYESPVEVGLVPGGATIATRVRF